MAIRKQELFSGDSGLGAGIIPPVALDLVGSISPLANITHEIRRVAHALGDSERDPFESIP